MYRVPSCFIPLIAMMPLTFGCATPIQPSSNEGHASQPEQKLENQHAIQKESSLTLFVQNEFGSLFDRAIATVFRDGAPKYEREEYEQRYWAGKIEPIVIPDRKTVSYVSVRGRSNTLLGTISKEIAKETFFGMDEYAVRLPYAAQADISILDSNSRTLKQYTNMIIRLTRVNKRQLLSDGESYGSGLCSQADIEEFQTRPYRPHISLSNIIPYIEYEASIPELPSIQPTKIQFSLNPTEHRHLIFIDDSSDQNEEDRKAEEPYVQGRIVDPLGAPVPAARISLVGVQRASGAIVASELNQAYSLLDGTFILALNPSDETKYQELMFRIEDAGGYRRKTVDLPRLTNEPLLLPDIVLDKGLELHGTVTNQDGNPLEVETLVRLWVDGASSVIETITERNGAFLFRGVPRNFSRAHIGAIATGYYIRTMDVANNLRRNKPAALRAERWQEGCIVVHMESHQPEKLGHDDKIMVMREGVSDGQGASGRPLNSERITVRPGRHLLYTIYGNQASLPIMLDLTANVPVVYAPELITFTSRISVISKLPYESSLWFEDGNGQWLLDGWNRISTGETLGYTFPATLNVHVGAIVNGQKRLFPTGILKPGETVEVVIEE